LRPDGEAYTADDLFGEEGESGLTFSPAGEWPPATYTIWFIPRVEGKGLADNSFVLLPRTTIFLCRNYAFGCRSRSKRREWCSHSA